MSSVRSIGTAISLAVIFSLLVNSCATIFHGSTDQVGFSSDPTGAKVYINGQFMGTTPFELRLEAKKTYTIEFRRDGYQNRTMYLNNHVGVGWVVLDVIFGLVPVIVDAATANWYHLDQDHVAAPLERADGR